MSLEAILIHRQESLLGDPPVFSLGSPAWPRDAQLDRELYQVMKNGGAPFVAFSPAVAGLAEVPERITFDLANARAVYDVFVDPIDGSAALRLVSGEVDHPEVPANG